MGCSYCEKGRGRRLPVACCQLLDLEEQGLEPSYTHSIRVETRSNSTMRGDTFPPLTPPRAGHRAISRPKVSMPQLY